MREEGSDERHDASGFVHNSFPKTRLPFPRSSGGDMEIRMDAFIQERLAIEGGVDDFDFDDNNAESPEDEYASVGARPSFSMYNSDGDDSDEDENYESDESSHDEAGATVPPMPPIPSKSADAIPSAAAGNLKSEGDDDYRADLKPASKTKPRKSSPGKKKAQDKKKTKAAAAKPEKVSSGGGKSKGRAASAKKASAPKEGGRKRKKPSEGKEKAGGVDNGQQGDPRMNGAVAARLADPAMTLLAALREGGFVFPDADKPGMQANSCFDTDGVSLYQRRNQLLRRIRNIKKRAKQGDE